MEYWLPVYAVDAKDGLNKACVARRRGDDYYGVFYIHPTMAGCEVGDNLVDGYISGHRDARIWKLLPDWDEIPVEELWDAPEPSKSGHYDHQLGVPQMGGAYAEDAGIYGWDLD